MPCHWYLLNLKIWTLHLLLQFMILYMSCDLKLWTLLRFDSFLSVLSQWYFASMAIIVYIFWVRCLIFLRHVSKCIFFQDHYVVLALNVCFGGHSVFCCLWNYFSMFLCKYEFVVIAIFYEMIFILKKITMIIFLIKRNFI